MEKLVWPGQYVLHAEALPGRPKESAKREALRLMSRAGQEAASGTGETFQRALTIYRQALVAWRSLQDSRLGGRDSRFPRHS